MSNNRKGKNRGKSLSVPTSEVDSDSVISSGEPSPIDIPGEFKKYLIMKSRSTSKGQISKGSGSKYLSEIYRSSSETSSSSPEENKGYYGNLTEVDKIAEMQRQLIALMNMVGILAVKMDKVIDFLGKNRGDKKRSKGKDTRYKSEYSTE